MATEYNTFTNHIYNFVFCFNQDMSDWWSLYITWSFNHSITTSAALIPVSLVIAESNATKRDLSSPASTSSSTRYLAIVFFFSQIVGTNNKRLFLLSKFNIDMRTEPDNSNSNGIKTCRACERRVPSLELLGAFSTGDVTPSVCSFQWCDLGFA